MAHASLFMAVASVLHVFDIGPPLDERGEPIAIKYEQTHGLLSCVHRPFVSIRHLANSSMGIMQVPGRLPVLHRTSLIGCEIPGVGCAKQVTSDDNFGEFRLMERWKNGPMLVRRSMRPEYCHGRRGAESISVLSHVRCQNHTRSRGSSVPHR